jgi:alanyl-tRNA synthetase
MGEGYPDLKDNATVVTDVAVREEETFRATLRSGLALLEAELARGTGAIAGPTAFRLHDQAGFPIELTREIAAERGVTVDEAGFATAMEEQRQRALAARKRRLSGTGDASERYRDLLNEFGPTRFVGYLDEQATARVLGVFPAGEGRVEVFLDTTPFYAEGGGQVGDTGTLVSATGTARVLDTTSALPGLSRHLAEVDGEILEGQEVVATIDGDRRAAIRRNHTGTHLLHWALRHVLGDHVKQQGSLVAPDKLRFDFAHYAPITAAERARIEDLVNERVLGDEPVVVTEMSRRDADQAGAIAFFEEKYGDTVRVLRAGADSVELCGGTHVTRLGMIGPFEITSEGSIGSNIRRIEATTGTATLARLRHVEETVGAAAALLKATPEELTVAIERKLADLRATEARLRDARRSVLAQEARELAARAAADSGVVVDRRDLPPDQLRDLALQVKAQAGVRYVVLGGSPEDGSVVLVAAVAKGEPIGAPALIGPAARLVGGGGGGKNPEFAQAGGRDASQLDAALAQIRRDLGVPGS